MLKNGKDKLLSRNVMRMLGGLVYAYAFSYVFVVHSIIGFSLLIPAALTYYMLVETYFD